MQRAMHDHPNERLIVLDEYGAAGILKVAQVDDRSRAQVLLRNLIGWGLGLRNAMHAEDRLQFEIRRLQELDRHGIAVPAVLAHGKNWLVMQKLDAPWLAAFQSSNDTERIERLAQAFTELGQLHAANEWHGGAQLRNLMWHNGRSYRIDFEETALLALALSTRQRFDLMILLLDVVRYCPAQPALAECLTRFLQAYRQAGGQYEHCRFLQKTARLLYWLTLPLRPLRGLLGRDGRVVLDFLAAMQGQSA